MTELKDVPVFAVGKWTAGAGKIVDVTESMLDDMVAAFNALGVQVTGFKPPLKLGHGEAQAFIGQSEGAPAMGWVSALRREGSKLLADFTNVPSALIDLIRRRHYNSVSVEILPTVEYAGSTFKNVLYAVAILGSEWPAVKGLPELSAALFSAGEGKVALTEVKPMTEAILKFSQEHMDTFVAAAVAAAKTQFADEHKAQVATLTKEVTDAQERATRSEAAMKTFKDEAASKEVNALVDAAVKAGTVLPAEKDDMVAFGLATIATGPLKVAGKDKAPIEIFKSMIAKRKGAVSFAEHGLGAGKENDKPADQVLDQRAKELMRTDDKLNYHDAVKAVMAQDHALQLAWLNEV
jgi:hypothetical protein